ncbi:hypothetical protein NPIL_467631 [Nephila pilipes]|uniref:Uncharacterized protein n=1 Tax=Nephila pilipes TaxID=299642 RepID=A0A8X6QEN6_NEPPI|nr:hypothetical protein NPIL_467631 [Nephila pilipes]
MLSRHHTSYLFIRVLINDGKWVLFDTSKSSKDLLSPKGTVPYCARLYTPKHYYALCLVDRTLRGSLRSATNGRNDHCGAILTTIGMYATDIATEIPSTDEPQKSTLPL